MIKVTIIKQKNKIKSIELKGHANYDTHGRDIVCASSTAIAVGGINAITEIMCDDSILSYVAEEGFIKLEIYDLFNERLQVILETLEIQLKSICLSYSKYIKITYQEVR